MFRKMYLLNFQGRGISEAQKLQWVAGVCVSGILEKELPIGCHVKGDRNMLSRVEGTRDENEF
jgi:hypothetical protein